MEQELFPEYPVLVVDDEKNFLNSVDFELLSYGITNVECCQDSSDVMPRLKRKEYSVILLDLIMPNISGEELLIEIVDKFPETPVIVVTAHPDAKTATDCMKNGAFDYLTKPVKIKNLIRIIKDALNIKDFHEDIILLKEFLFSDTQQVAGNFPDIITNCKKMLSIFQTIGLISVTSRPILIIGESGVGKELVAREIHKQSKRIGEFITYNTTGIDDYSFSDMLFGRIRGALYDEENSGEALLEKAQGGTLYLADIGELSIKSQEKLLHLLQEWEYFPRGSDKSVANNTRIIAATKKNLQALVKVNTFRDDLYSLLKAHEIYIPPLRERIEDIPLLVDYFVKKAAETIGIKKPLISEKLFVLLEQYDFPENILELRDMVYDAVNKHISGTLLLDVFEERIKSQNFSSSYKFEIPANKKIFFEKDLPTFAELEAIYIDEIMKRSRGDQTVASSLAGINVKTFINRLKRIKRKMRKMSNKH